MTIGEGRRDIRILNTVKVTPVEVYKKSVKLEEAHSVEL